MRLICWSKKYESNLSNFRFEQKSMSKYYLGKRKLELQYILLNKTCVIITLMQKENLEGFS